MTEPTPCPACDGARVAAKVRSVEPSDNGLWLWRVTRRGWSSRNVTPLQALACTGCGLVTLHATDLAALRTDVEENPDLYHWG